MPFKKGNKINEEHKRKIVESNKGKFPLKEKRKKISNTLKGGNSTSFKVGHNRLWEHDIKKMELNDLKEKL